MRLFYITLFIFIFSILCAAQPRREAIEKFNELKAQAEIHEKRILSPDNEDLEKARRENFGVFRILPRETYDKGLFTTRGGGAFYSFYYKIPDYGYGSDIMLEQGFLSTPNVGLLTDLGEVSLNDISRESPSANNLIDYRNAKSTNSVYRDFSLFRSAGLTVGGAVYKSRVPAVVGHSYVIRSLAENYYDVLVAFKVHRKDADGSLVIFWKMLEQFETPKREKSQKVLLSDAEILKSTERWLSAGYFSGVQADVADGVTSLRGTIAKEHLSYAVQLAHDSGAVKVINQLDVK